MGRFFLLLCPLLFAVLSCAPGVANIDYTLHGGIVWPGPPEKPRVKYLWSLSDVQSDGKGPGGGDIYFGAVSRQDSPTLMAPHGLFVDGSERLYIADPGGMRINVINLRNNESFYFYGVDSGDLRYPISVAASPDGSVFVTDAELKKVFVFDERGRFRFAFEGEFMRPTGLAVDARAKRVYVADTWAHTLQVHDFSGKRIGTIGKRGEDDGEFNFPTHLAVGRDGSVYVSDTGNFRVQVFGPDGVFQNSFGQPGDSFRDFDKIKGIALDTEGNIYVVDSSRDTVKIYDRQGRLLLFFGEKGGFYGQFLLPTGIFVDSRNRVYVSDTLNMRVQAFQFMGGD